MKKVIVVTFLISFVNCFSSVIYPKSLRQISNSSNLVAYCKVLKITETTRGKSLYYYDRIATLEIIETLKGEYKKTTIEISYNSSHSCAPTPKFNLEKKFLVFIWQKDNLNHVTGFAYGAKASDNLQYRFLKERVLEIQQIEKSTDTISQLDQVKNWAMKCLQNPQTKIDGAWELSKESLQKRLDKDDKEKIKEVLFNHSFDYDIDFRLAKILRNDYKKEIEELLTLNFKTVDEEKVTYVFEDFYNLLFHLGNQDENKKLYQDFEKISLEYGKEKEIMKIKDDFIKSIVK